MLLELHCHTRERSRCSHISVLELVREVREKELQGLILTDHHAVWSEQEIRELRHQAAGRADAIAQRLAEAEATLNLWDTGSR